MSFGFRISLSISIREPKLGIRLSASLVCISLSISIREPKHGGYDVIEYKVSVYQYPSENQNFIGLRFHKRLYQFINIHQRTKTLPRCMKGVFQYQFINIHQNQNCKHFLTFLCAVSVYQYPSENQNLGTPYKRFGTVSVYQYPSENQNT